MAGTIIETKALTKRYGALTAVDDLNLTVRQGEVFGLLGPNGAGKTTTTLMLLGLTEPTAGSASISGVDCTRNPIQVKRFVGYLPDNMGFYPDMTGRQNLRMTGAMNGLSGDYLEARIDELVARVGMTEAVDRRAGTYSKGMKQRLGIADILIKDPDVLIMDEPGNDLDTDMLAVMEDLLDTWPGTLIVVSHDRYLLERVTDQQFALIGGKVRHLPGGVQDYLDMVEAIKNGKGLPADTPGFAGTGSSSAKSGKGKAAAVNAAASLPQSASRIAPSSEGANNGEDSTSKLTGKAFHEASKRVNAIERKLAKLEEQKADLEAQMAAHDPSDYEGLNKLNEQLTAVNTESDDLEAEWLELSEQLE